VRHLRLTAGAWVAAASAVLALAYRGVIVKVDAVRGIVVLKSGSGQVMAMPVAH
jgi:hypothetical protein